MLDRMRLFANITEVNVAQPAVWLWLSTPCQQQPPDCDHHSGLPRTAGAKLSPRPLAEQRATLPATSGSFTASQNPGEPKQPPQVTAEVAAGFPPTPKRSTMDTSPANWYVQSVGLAAGWVLTHPPAALCAIRLTPL